MNDFEKMCRNLEKCKMCGCVPCVKNEYVCAKRSVKNYICDDWNKLLKLKSEVLMSKYESNLSNMMAIYAILIAVISFIANIVGYLHFDEIESGIYIMIMLLLATVALVIILIFMKRYVYVPRWKGYIQVAIEEMEKELKR